MSDLHLALIGFGIFIIAGVLVYNWVQELKLRRHITQDFVPPAQDVLDDNFHIDPNAFAEASPTKDVEAEQPVLTKAYKAPEIAAEPSSSEVEVSEPSDSQPSTYGVLSSNQQRVRHVEQAEPVEPEIEQDDLPGGLHPQIDLTAYLYATKQIGCEHIHTLAERIIAEMGIPMMVHGKDQDNRWHLVDRKTKKTQNYKQVACSLQLADRRGPVSRELLNQFQFSIERMGLDLGAHVEWQGAGDALQRAVDLDKFCMEVDQVVSIHLIQGETPIHGTKFKGLAESSGMMLADDGKFHFMQQSGTEVCSFTLANTAQDQVFSNENLRSGVIKNVTFQLEIPKVTHCEQAFNLMVSVAMKMSNSLGARIVDDNQKPLGELQMEKIRQQLKVIHATMLARGVMPGSPCSARLFN